MKWAYLVKEKMKAVAVLLLIIVLILVNNISNRKTFSKLNESIASIYKDRLMPATYIFQLTDHLYQKKFLLNEMQANDNAAIATRHDSAIHAIIKTYEATFLTPAEKKHWVAFKKELEQYNTLTSGLYKNSNTVNESFDNVMQRLNSLSEIQASEGSHIFSIARIDVGGTIIMSHLEVALLLILGIFALVLISANDNKLMQVQKARLN